MNAPVQIDTGTAEQIFSIPALRAISAEADRSARYWRGVHKRATGLSRQCGYDERARRFEHAAYLAEDCLIGLDGWDSDGDDPQQALLDYIEQVGSPCLVYAWRAADKADFPEAGGPEPDWHPVSMGRVD